MPLSAETRRRVDELVAHVNHLREQRLDFPTIWHEHLRGHPLVVGIPVQVSLGDRPGLEMQLIDGRRLHFVGGKFQLE